MNRASIPRKINLQAIYLHAPHPHTPRNSNDVHKAEQQAAGFNQKIAITLTKAVGTMLCAYVFMVLAILGLPNLFPPVFAQWVQWISQTFIQLVMLSILMVGQSILGRKQEIQSQEQFETTIKTYHDIEQVMQHLSAQDAELLKHTEALEKLVKLIAQATNREVA